MLSQCFWCSGTRTLWSVMSLMTWPEARLGRLSVFLFTWQGQLLFWKSLNVSDNWWQNQNYKSVCWRLAHTCLCGTSNSDLWPSSMWEQIVPEADLMFDNLSGLSGSSQQSLGGAGLKGLRGGDGGGGRIKGFTVELKHRQRQEKRGLKNAPQLLDQLLVSASTSSSDWLRLKKCFHSVNLPAAWPHVTPSAGRRRGAQMVPI